MAYAKMNKNKEAEEAYKNALRLDPENADYQNNLSVTQQRIQEGKIHLYNILKKKKATILQNSKITSRTMV